MQQPVRSRKKAYFFNWTTGIRISWRLGDEIVLCHMLWYYAGLLSNFHGMLRALVNCAAWPPKGFQPQRFGKLQNLWHDWLRQRGGHIESWSSIDMDTLFDASPLAVSPSSSAVSSRVSLYLSSSRYVRFCSFFCLFCHQISIRDVACA